MGGALLATGMAWLNRQRAYLKMAKLRFIQSLLVAPVVILLGLYGYKTGLLVAQVVALVIMSAVFLVLISGIQINRRELAMKEVAAKHIVAPKYLLPTAFLDTVTQQLPILLITAWYSSEAAGQFSMAWKILALPMTLIGGAVGQVFIQRFSQLWPDALSARKLLFKTWKVLALIGLIPTVLIMLFGEQLFGWVLGSAWVGAGRIAGVIAPMLFAMLISSTTSGIFLTLGLQKFSLFFGVSFILYRSGSMYFGVIYNSVLYGLAAWVLCEIVAISVYNWIALKRISK